MSWFTLENTLTAAYLAILLVLAVYGFHRTLLLYWYRRERTRDPQPKARYGAAELPCVTVQLPLFNEMYVAPRLLDAVAEIDYPRDRFEIQVLDDSTDDTVDLCKKK